MAALTVVVGVLFDSTLAAVATAFWAIIRIGTFPFKIVIATLIFITVRENQIIIVTVGLAVNWTFTVPFACWIVTHCGFRFKASGFKMQGKSLTVFSGLSLVKTLQLESVPYSSGTNTLRIRVLNARTKICWLRCSSASLLRTCRSLVGCAASLFHVF